jgi:digeranylgeranylglycerophospholipid reductase
MVVIGRMWFLPVVRGIRPGAVPRGDSLRRSPPWRSRASAHPPHTGATAASRCAGIVAAMDPTHARFAADVVIVGASFAGAACALAAAQRGLRVCVLERKDDPGAKLHTTGIIVKEAAERTLLGRLPAPLVRRVTGVRLHAPGLASLDLAAPGYYFLTTDTPAVMRWLAGQLRAGGVDLRLGTAFTGCERTADGWQVHGVGVARYLVGADGARSRVAARCGLGQVRDFLYGIEYEFPGACLARPDALHCFVSKRFAPGYIGWIAQNPTGVQAGLARRHDPARARAPDLDEFLLHVGRAGGLPRRLTPGHVRAGLIPCGGPVRDLARDRVILTGDAAGLVSPVTAGGIHSAWAHGEAVGHAIAAHLRDGGPPPEPAAIAAAPRFRAKRALRWAFDHLQLDWPFDLLLHTPPLRWAAEQVYFHKRR